MVAGKAMIPAPTIVVDKLNTAPVKEAPFNSSKPTSSCLLGNKGAFSSTGLFLLDFLSFFEAIFPVVIFLLSLTGFSNHNFQTLHKIYKADYSPTACYKDICDIKKEKKKSPSKLQDK
jgi:hypothetical protein